jgi:hypothetical protein
VIKVGFTVMIQKESNSHHIQTELQPVLNSIKESDFDSVFEALKK